MDAAVEAERKRYSELASRYGDALQATAAIQRQVADWITDKGEALTPEQFAALFWSHDNNWQAAFFNALQATAEASYAAQTDKPGAFRWPLGVPAGEGQWCWMAEHLDDKGFETLEAMFWHAKTERDRALNKARSEQVKP